MYASFSPPRQVAIGDAASFVGTTPRAIRHYHQIGLLPEPERSRGDRRRYGYAEMIRLLWIRKMADAGIALTDIRAAFADTAPAGAHEDQEVARILERLEETLAAQQAELERQRSAVHRMRTRGSRMGLLSDVVASRLEGLPDGSLRQSDLDSLLVTERIFGRLGAAVQATRFLALATHPDLREESDRVDAAEEALDDTVAVDDPRVAQVAAERRAFELRLHAVIEESGLAEDEEALFDSWEDLHPGDEGEAGDGAGQEPMSVVAAVGKMPYDFSPARLRCLELADGVAAHEPPVT
ncbi:MerR family transcriptional regulator [Desertihabitans brevis]|uniref:MerR family transcriptional regulator n=1 Tax=Desertihabitans brevis TaxID=2268447 RepID=A0A367YY78_9ACTN|nr:MerR family transcriptional regulator [Desertihabitans brevis]RCK70790.1 MerR family transcriptional regulator [Desertihabitans brevis]